MKKVVTYIKFLYGFTFCLPHLVIYSAHRNKRVIQADVKKWLEVEKKSYSTVVGLAFLLSHFREYRNLFYYRIGGLKYILNIWCPKMRSLYLNSAEIGEGLYIQHGENTRIGAKTVGKNCWINHGVTIGWEQRGQPVILDNVRIGVGAKVIGKVVVGNNSIIGANAVIVKDVPDNCTVVGVYPVYIVKRDGQKVKEVL